MTQESHENCDGLRGGGDPLTTPAPVLLALLVLLLLLAAAAGFCGVTMPVDSPALYWMTGSDEMAVVLRPTGPCDTSTRGTCIISAVCSTCAGKTSNKGMKLPEATNPPRALAVSGSLTRIIR
jgi:hypothetical protein